MLSGPSSPDPSSPAPPSRRAHRAAANASQPPDGLEVVLLLFHWWNKLDAINGPSRFYTDGGHWVVLSGHDPRTDRVTVLLDNGRTRPLYTLPIEGGKAKIFLNDFTGPKTSKGSKPQHADWVKELDTALKDPRFGFGKSKRATDIKKAIEDARRDGEVYTRTVRVNYGADGVKTTIGNPVKVGP